MKTSRSFKFEPKQHQGFRGEVRLLAEGDSVLVTLQPADTATDMVLSKEEALLLAQELLRMAEGLP